MRNPITRLPREQWRQQKLAEFFQVMQQMILPGSIQQSPMVIFGQALNYEELKQLGGNNNIMKQIIGQAKFLYESQADFLQ
jgi:hypothetical protein